MKKMLLDENLPYPLKKCFSSGFDVTTVHDMIWQSLKNGQLLQAMMKEGIEILITADRNLKYQQNIGKFSIQVVVLITYDNRYRSIEPWVPKIEDEIQNLNDEDKFVEIDIRN